MYLLCGAYTRGAEFSRPVQEYFKSVRHLVSLGAKVNYIAWAKCKCLSWGGSQRIRGVGVRPLVREMGDIEGLERIRYTTSHPSDMTQALIDAHRDVPQLMPYLHLPVQAGSNRVLQAMNRKHTRENYLDIMDRLRQARPDIALASDFIVGFPDETMQNFKKH